MSEPPATAPLPDPAKVLAFWREAGATRWFSKDADFDALIGERFLAIYEAAVRGELAAWEETPEGALALVIVLDQFPRNMFRNDARTYAADAAARVIADRAIARGFDALFPVAERSFFYLPFEHSEDLADQERSVALFKQMGDPELLKWADLHADIIRRFGRFPHRNAVLDRPSTPEEKAFLAGGGFSG